MAALPKQPRTMPAVTQKRGPWSKDEDRQLLALVRAHGAQNWVKISSQIATRSPKQCRERYHQNLKPTLNHSPISPDEGEQIEHLVRERGKNWAAIARSLPGRSDNAVKNWWNGGMNRRRRLMVRRDGPVGAMQNFNEQTQPLSFARPPPPLGQLSLPIDPPRAPVEGPLVSPALSIGSAGDAPSLVSDNGSFQTAPSPSRPLHSDHHGFDGGLLRPMSTWSGPPSYATPAPQHTFLPLPNRSSHVLTHSMSHEIVAPFSSRLQALSHAASNQSLSSHGSMMPPSPSHIVGSSTQHMSPRFPALYYSQGSSLRGSDSTAVPTNFAPQYAAHREHTYYVQQPKGCSADSETLHYPSSDEPSRSWARPFGQMPGVLGEVPKQRMLEGDQAPAHHGNHTDQPKNMMTVSAILDEPESQ